MNKVTVTSGIKERIPRIGDIYVNLEANDLYILAKVNDETNCFAAICLNDGGRWSDPEGNIYAVVDGLEFVGRDMVIEIKQKEE